MKAEQDKNLSQWMNRKETVYTSPKIQKVIVKLLGIKVLREQSSNLQSSPFLIIKVDETTDVSNTELAAIVIHCFQDFHVHEEFIGLYCTPPLKVGQS